MLDFLLLCQSKGLGLGDFEHLKVGVEDLRRVCMVIGLNFVLRARMW